MYISGMETAVTLCLDASLQTVLFYDVRYKPAYIIGY